MTTDNLPPPKSRRKVRLTSRAVLTYYRAHPRDFFEWTIGMYGELKGFYRVMLDLIYMQGGAVLCDWRFISGHVGHGIRKTKSLCRDLIKRGKLELVDTDEGLALTNDRATREIEAVTTPGRPKGSPNRAENSSKTRRNVTEITRETQPELRLINT